MAALSSITNRAAHEAAEPPIDAVGALLADAMLAAVLGRPERGCEGVEPRGTPAKPAPAAAVQLELA